MNIEATLTQAVKKAVSELYGTEVSDNQVQLSKTKKEFEGHLTLEIGRASCRERVLRLV